MYTKKNYFIQAKNTALIGHEALHITSDIAIVKHVNY